MTPRQLFDAVVAFAKDYDWPDGRIRDIIFYGPDAPYPPQHIQHYNCIADIVCLLYNAYDYTRCPRFLAGIRGKSAEFCRMKLKLETAPAKRASHLQAFLKALHQLPNSREVYELLDSSEHPRIDTIVDALNRIGVQEA
jgi:hypothetical protein